jgi:predicted nucleic acid-binding protein
VLVINPIIYAELSVGIAKIEALDDFLGGDFRRDPLPWDAAFLAGKAFLAYRKRDGTKSAPLPDFYIGAHAAVQRMQILTRDSKRYRAYFPTVLLIEP